MKNDNRKKESMNDSNFLQIVDHFFQSFPIKQFLNQAEQLIVDSLNVPYFKINTFDLDDEFIIEVLTTSIKKEQIKLDLYDKYLTISIENKVEIEEINEKSETFKKVSSFGNFSRTIILPHHVNEEELETSYEENRLLIKFPVQNK